MRVPPDDRSSVSRNRYHRRESAIGVIRIGERNVFGPCRNAVSIWVFLEFAPVGGCQGRAILDIAKNPVRRLGIEFGDRPRSSSPPPDQTNQPLGYFLVLVLVPILVWGHVATPP